MDRIPVKVEVSLADRSYQVTVGSSILGSLPEVVASVAVEARRSVIVTQEGIPVTVDPGIPSEVLTVPPGEDAKAMTVVESLCSRMALAGMTRSDLVIAVGGGVVTDLAGFAASVYHRGIRYINVATTLLAQVDAAIGGKTGVNLPEGKNLAGTFWQPSAVLCDVATLATLPSSELASGRGEIAKYAFIDSGGQALSVGSGQESVGAAGGAFDSGEGNRAPGGAIGAALLSMDLIDQVAHCAGIKAAIVSGDERESRSGRRVLLNYGHTLAHALEGVGGLAGGDARSPVMIASQAGPDAGPDSGSGDGPPSRLLHGEAVAIGLVYAAELACKLGRINAERVGEHRAVVDGLGLPSVIPPGTDASALIEFMRRDKKVTGSLDFVLDGPGGLERVSGVPEDVVADTLSGLFELRR